MTDFLPTSFASAFALAPLRFFVWILMRERRGSVGLQAGVRDFRGDLAKGFNAGSKSGGGLPPRPQAGEGSPAPLEGSFAVRNPRLREGRHFSRSTVRTWHPSRGRGPGVNCYAKDLRARWIFASRRGASERQKSMGGGSACGRGSVASGAGGKECEEAGGVRRPGRGGSERGGFGWRRKGSKRNEQERCRGYTKDGRARIMWTPY